MFYYIAELTKNLVKYFCNSKRVSKKILKIKLKPKKHSKTTVIVQYIVVYEPNKDKTVAKNMSLRNN